MGTATVETLTAEVRVLMVGNRQVTLSVYRQLDVALAQSVEPFGRVNDSKDVGLWVVGRHKATGELVRASATKPRQRPHVVAGDLSGTVSMCSAHRPNYHLDQGARFHQREIDISYDLIDWCNVPDHVHRRTECGHWRTNDHDLEIERVIAIHDAEVANYKECRELPLIVLAGLR